MVHTIEPKWRRSDSQVSSAVDGEFVLMGLHNSLYYGLKSSGSRIWQMLENPVTETQIVDALLAEYEVARETCAQDVRAFLQKLAEEALITKIDESGSAD